MATINPNTPVEQKMIDDFLLNAPIELPNGFIDFYKKNNGAEIISDNTYTIIWKLDELLQNNNDYAIDEFAPHFFIFGSDSADTAFVIERNSGKIFEMPFIGMSNDEALFISDTFEGFLNSRLGE